MLESAFRGNTPLMISTFRDAFIKAIETTGRSVRSVARAAGVSEEQLKSLYQGKSRSTNVDDARRIAAEFGVSLDDFLTGHVTAEPGATITITIAGKVGAGAVVELADPYAKGAGPQVELPPGLPDGGIVAVEVAGDSMEPAYFAGDLLFYTRHTHEGVPSEAIGRPCVTEDAEGNVWVKQVKRGEAPGLFHLVSLNPGATTMWNVALKWAAPVRLHWPAELARKI